VRQFAVEAGVQDEFAAAYGYPMHTSGTGAGAAWYADVMAVFAALSVVDNNGPGSVGGGGVPRQPLAPPFCNERVGAA
jgi:hypothetical protein